MTTRQRLDELKNRIDPAVLAASADEYADLLITMCLCMRLAGLTRANITACAKELRKRFVTCHSINTLDSIITSWDPVGAFLSIRREANEAAASYGEPADKFI